MLLVQLQPTGSMDRLTGEHIGLFLLLELEAQMAIALFTSPLLGLSLTFPTTTINSYVPMFPILFYYYFF
ncbi:hypothetical protein OESDEN_02722 [Oesophagostomum dentatum]|uniref:Uncharacterized protein n=1 Tax=Oesophagostomum dentatum TaxID=61180 RepID=A0A0B1TPH5_OESDE|nr:hypothetical protein OESDEN_02722 [Oesophagostomum dentatum]